MSWSVSGSLRKLGGASSGGGGSFVSNLGKVTKGVAGIGTGGLRALNSVGQKAVRSPMFDYAMEGASVPVRTLASIGNLVRGQNPAEPWQTGKAMNEWDTWKSALLGGAMVGGGAYALSNPVVAAGGVSGEGAIAGGTAAGAGAATPGVGLTSAGFGAGLGGSVPASVPGIGMAASGFGAGVGGALPATGGLAAGGAAGAAGASTLMNPYAVGGILAGKGILSYLQGQEQKSDTDPYAQYSRNAMRRLNEIAENPNSMYQNDPGLRQLRKNALDAVTSRQLAATGGTEGGNYARQLMAESANIDRQNMMTLANLEATIAGQAAPFAQANIEMGNPAYTAGSQVLNDAAFMNLIGQLGLG